MKYIDIFLASSITDMREDRLELGNYIRSLNDMYVEQGIYFRLNMCEYMSDEVAEERKQNEYNEEIKKSDLFVIMFWHRVGEYTAEEFEVALERFRASGAPHIFTFFKEIPGEETMSADVKDFMRYLGEDVQHYYTVFSHIDSVKFKLLLALSRHADLGAKIHVENDELIVDNIALNTIHTKNLPVYANNTNLQKARAELSKLEAEFQEAKLKALLSADTNGLEQLLTISERKNKKAEEVRRIEDEIMAAATHIVGMTEQGEYMTERAQKAINLFELGRLDEALLILNDEERKNSAKEAIRFIEHGKRELMALIGEIRLKIKALRARGIGQNEQNLILELYKEAQNYVLEGNLDRSILIEYVSFLDEQGMSNECIQIGNRLLGAVETTEAEDAATKAKLHLVMANAYQQMSNYEDAGLEVQKAKTDAQAMDAEDDALWCNLLTKEGELSLKTNDMDKAKQALINNQSKLKELAKKDPAMYQLVLIKNTIRLGEMQRKDNQLVSIETGKEAVRMLRELVEKEPSNETLKFQLTEAYQSLAISCKRFKHYEETEECYEEAIRIRKELAEKNPLTYEPPLALLLSNYSIHKEEVGSNLDEAEDYIQQALTIRRRLQQIDADRYTGRVGISLRQAARIYEKQGNMEKAGEVYREAIPLMEAVISTKPGAYMSHFSVLALSYGIYMRKSGNYAESETYLKRAAEIVEGLVKKTPDMEKNLRLVNCYSELTILYNMLGRSEAKNCFETATALRDKFRVEYKDLQSRLIDVMEEHYLEAKKSGESIPLH